jgi:predicted nucleic acid-binding protein
LTCFVDTSAVVKLYVAEDGAEVVRDLEGLMISELTRVEVPAAVWRKRRAGELTSEVARSLAGEFEADYYGTGGAPRFAVMRISDLTLALAASVVARSDLRAGDAIQLASALVARQVGREVTAFAAFDSRLRDAAAIEGFALIPPTLAA